MTLATEIHAALAAPLALLTTELGETARLRRRSIGRAEDGTRRSTVDRVPGAAEPITILPVTRNASARAAEWGRDVVVAMEVFIQDTVPIAERDVVRMLTGPFTGQWFEAIERRREPVAGIDLWRFVTAPTLDDQDVGF